MKKTARTLACLLLPLMLLFSCGPSGKEESASTIFSQSVSLVGDWRAVLTSPGGELPFTLRISDSGGQTTALIVNGEEEVPLTGLDQEGAKVVLRFDWYDSEITANLNEDGDTLQGMWRKTIPGGNSTLPFRATLSAVERFMLPTEIQLANIGSPPPSIHGNWKVEFRDGESSEPARGEFHQEGTRVLGTFLTPTGDYRFLEGSYEQGLLRLSTFDGAHAFLFHGRAQADGSLEGDFWSRDTYHATWTAEQIAAEEEILPDAWQLVGLTNGEGSFDFSFPDLSGKSVTLQDDRFQDKVVLVNIFGSWCPNCNDEAPLLATWDQRYRDQGLEAVGLAYEFSGDGERDREMVQRFAQRYGIEYPLLLAGVSDKEAAAETLPDLTAVIAYPTSIFIGRDGKVRKIHSGFSGPGTGRHYEELVAELEGLIEELLAEPTVG